MKGSHGGKMNKEIRRLKMKSNRIKKVIRIGLPETNSSSSHSVSINMGNDFICPGDPRFNLIIKDDTLFIPERTEGFGWEVEKYNDPGTKLQYVCGIYCSDINTHRGCTRITKLKRLLCELLGVSNVVFEWDVNYFQRLNKLKLDEPGESEDWYREECYRNYPEINHNSTDIFDEIIESRETIKHFIFNPNSWLYLGNDNSSYPAHFFDDSWIEPEDDEPEFRGYIEMGGNIGRLDFDVPYIKHSECNGSFLSRCEELEDILFELYYDVGSGNYIARSPLTLNKNWPSIENNYLSYSYSQILDCGNGNFSIILTNKNFQDVYLIYMNTKREWDKKSGASLEKWNQSQSSLVKFLESDECRKNLVKNVDYKFFEVHLKSQKNDYVIC